MNPFPPGRAARGSVLLKLLVFLVIVFLLGVIFLLRRPLLREAGRLLIVDEAPRAADAILVLGDDDFAAARAARAAELFHQGWGPRVVASGRYLRPYASIADLMRRDLTDRGVPRDAVVHFPHRADSTREEALALRSLVRERGWRRLLLVTSHFHTRRARYIFRKVLGPSIELSVIAAPHLDVDPDSWWESRPGLKFFFREVLAWVVALWEMRGPVPAAALSPAERPVAGAPRPFLQASGGDCFFPAPVL